MNDQSVLDGILHHTRSQISDASQQTRDTEVARLITTDFGSFGWLYQPRDSADMLELRLKTGNIGAIAYGWIEFAEFDPSVGITLDARGKKFLIKGRNLNGESREGVRMFEGIVRRRVLWIREADRTVSIEAHDGATVIESINW